MASSNFGWIRAAHTPYKQYGRLGTFWYENRSAPGHCHTLVSNGEVNAAPVRTKRTVGLVWDTKQCMMVEKAI